MLFKSTFKGCRTGEVYPSTFAPGEPCPPELREAAAEVGALESAEEAKARAAAEKAAEKAAQKRVAALLEVAAKANIEIGDGATEAEIVAALTAAGVEIPQA